jgi:hypothetical protein
VYQEIAISLKGEEWRVPSLVALASKLSECGGERDPIEVDPTLPTQELPPELVEQAGAAWKRRDVGGSVVEVVPKNDKP